MNRDPHSPPPNRAGNPFRTILRRLLWLALFIVGSYAALILLWVILNPRI